MDEEIKCKKEAESNTNLDNENDSELSKDS
jgi:hypothetical protein